MLSVKFEQAFFFRGFSGDRRQAKASARCSWRGRLFLAPSTVARVTKIACGHRRISGRRVRLPSRDWKTRKKCFFRRLDKTHYRIRLPIRSCIIPVRAGYVDTSYSPLSAFLPSVTFRTTNRHTLIFICCLKCISTWIRAYLKETYQVYTWIRSEWVCASLLVQASFPQCYSHPPITREKRPLLAGKVAAYSPIFRGCFRVAGHSAV